MSRDSLIALSIFYLLFSVGINVTYHQCNLQISDKEEVCSCTGNAEESDCCYENDIFFQFDNAHQIVQDLRSPVEPPYAAKRFHGLFNERNPVSHDLVLLSCADQDVHHPILIYVRYQRLTFYG